MTDPYLLTGIINALTASSLGLFVYLKGRKPLHLCWFLMGICVAAWALLVGIERTVMDPFIHLKLDQIEQSFAIWIPVLFLHTVTYFTSRQTSRPHYIWLKLAYLTTAGIAITIPTPLFMGIPKPQPVFDGRLYDTAGPLYFLFPLSYTIIVAYASALLLRATRRVPPPAKLPYKLLLGGTGLGFLLGATCFPLVFDIQFPPYGFHFVWLYTLFVTYAIFRHQLWDIQIVIRGGFLSFFLLALLLAGYFGLVFAAQQLFRMTLLQHHILALALTSFTTFALGLLVFLAEPKRRLNQIFGLYSLCISGWAFSEILVYGASTPATANWYSYLEWPIVILIAPTFRHTVFLLIGKRLPRKSLWLTYGVSSLFLALHLIGNMIAAPVREVGYVRFANSLTQLGLLVPLTFLLAVNTALFHLWSEYRRTTGTYRTQLKYLFWASVIGYLGGSPDWFLTVGFWVPGLNPFGIYTVPLYSIATTYAVLQHKLFDVNLVIRKSLVYSLLVSLLTTGYFGLIYGIERFSQLTAGYTSHWLSLSAFTLMAVVFQPLKFWIQRGVDWLFFGVRHEELIKRMERLEEEVRQTEKLKSVATLATGLCHELRNPLQTIQTYAEFLPERYDSPDFRKQCKEAMRTEVTRINDFLKQLMEFSKPKTLTLQEVEPHKILDSTLDLLSNEFVRRQVQLERQYTADGAQILADPGQIRQVILNLTLNALEAIGRNGTILVTTRQEDACFALELTDSGPGIDPKVLPKLFEPFSTTKPDGNGLGLSIVHSIVKEHGGRISVTSQPGKGASFLVKLPLR